MAYISPNQPFKIINRKSGMALSATGAEEDSDVVLWKFVNGAGQLWHLIDVGGGACHIENRDSGRVLTFLDSFVPGTTLHIRSDFLDSPTRLWRIEPGLAGFVRIASQYPGLIVACKAGGTTNGTPILLWDPMEGEPDQDWSIEPVPAFDPAAAYRIVNRKSQTLLCIVDAGTANGSRTNLYPDVEAEDQRWHVIEVGNGYQKLVNHHSGRILCTLDGESSNGTAVHLWDDLITAPDQHWGISPTSDGYVKITNRMCGRAVSCVEGRTDDKTRIHLWDFLGDQPDQEWRIEQVEQRVDVFAREIIARPSPFMTGICLEDVNHSVYGGIDSQMIFGESFQEPPAPDPDVPYVLRNQKSGHVLSVRQRGVENGSLIITWAFVGAPDQFWKIVDVDSGFYKLVNQYSGRVLSTLNGGAGNHTPVHLWDYAGAPDQHWALVGVGEVVRLMNRTSRRVASSRGGDTHNDARVELFDHVGAFDLNIKHQDWKLEPQAPVTRPEVSGMWRAFVRGDAEGTFSLGNPEPDLSWRAQTITFARGTGEVGIENRSLNRWGMNVQGGVNYEGYLHVRAAEATEVFVGFEDASGHTLAEATFTVDRVTMERYDFMLSPALSNPHGVFIVKLTQPGSIDVGFAFVQPEESARFERLPVRKDIGEALRAQGNTLMRFGGSAVNTSAYRLANMSGPRNKRKFTGGLFYPYTSNGWTILEFLHLAKALDVVGVPVVSIDESPQEVMKFLEFVGGPPHADKGFPSGLHGPLRRRLSYLELGNELGNTAPEDTPSFFDKFATLASHIWERDPDIQLILGDWEHPDIITDDPNFKHRRILNLNGHKKVLDIATQHGRELWIDCHLWTDDVHPGSPHEKRYDAYVLLQVAALQSLYRKLRQLSPRARFKLVVFEFNANSHDLHRALANALAMNALLRMGDRVRMVASANTLQPYEQNDNVWDQGLLFFDTHRVWAQPAYYVNRMKSAHAQPLVVRAQVSGRESNTFDITATLSEDRRTLILHVVNTLHLQRRYRFVVNEFTPASTSAHFTVLSGTPGAKNSAENPYALVPIEYDDFYSRTNDTITLTFAPSSFTIVRLQ